MTEVWSIGQISVRSRKEHVDEPPMLVLYKANLLVLILITFEINNGTRHIIGPVEFESGITADLNINYPVTHKI
jgi:hypothetical protein